MLNIQFEYCPILGQRFVGISGPKKKLPARAQRSKKRKTQNSRYK